MNENIEKDIKFLTDTSRIIKILCDRIITELGELKKNIENMDSNEASLSNEVGTPHVFKIAAYRDLTSSTIEQIKKITKKISYIKDDKGKNVILSNVDEEDRSEISLEEDKDKSSGKGKDEALFDRAMFKSYREDIQHELNILEKGIDDLLKLRSIIKELKDLDIFSDDLNNEVSENQFLKYTFQISGFVRRFNLHLIFLNIISLFFFILYIEIHLNSSLYCTIV